MRRLWTLDLLDLTFPALVAVLFARSLIVGAAGLVLWVVIISGMQHV